MEEIVTSQGSIKRFKAAFLLFFIGQILRTIGALRFGAQFKFLPSWLIFFSFFEWIGYVLFFISFMLIYKYNRHFLRSLITSGIAFGTILLTDVCSKSTDDLYLMWAKGLNWSNTFLMCILYICFFMGCHDYFHSLGIEKGKKHSRTAYIGFPVLFGIERLLTLFAGFSFVKLNIFANRICTYGSWLFDFVIYIFAIIMTALIYVMLTKRLKEGSYHETEIE